MRMRWIIVIGIFFSFEGAQSETLKTLKSFLTEQLGAYKKLTRESVKIPKDLQVEWSKELKTSVPNQAVLYFGKSPSGETQKSCTVVPQEGKEGPMDVGVCFSSKGSVTAVDYLVFNEERGQKVRESGFLKQFIGKSSKNKYKIGEDIDVVTGATHSAEAVADAVHKASLIFNKYGSK